MGTATMTDEPIRSGEFNAAFKGVKDALGALSERIAALEGLQTANLQAKIQEAEQRGARDADLRHIEKRLDRLSMAIGVVAAGFAGQLLWWVFTKIAH